MHPMPSPPTIHRTIKTMSETPRVDAEFAGYECLNPNIRNFACGLEKEITTLTASCAAKTLTLDALITRLEFIHESPEYKNVWICSHNHLGPYTGPKYVKELEAAKEALSDTAGQELLDELTAAKELLREIRDGEVNAQDEADKFLRDHQPSALSLASARVKALEDALGWASSEAKGRLPDWFHDLLKGDATPVNDAETLAEMFHETYERRAGEFGYKTREASAVPWRDVPENNKRLMIAVCGELIARKALTQPPV